MVSTLTEVGKLAFDETRVRTEIVNLGELLARTALRISEPRRPDAWLGFSYE